MTYVPQSDGERRELLETIGVKDVAELLESIPEQIRLSRPLDLPEAMSELEVLRHLSELSQCNESCDQLINFTGAGAYDHYLPAIVPFLTGRSEFQTAYTPYQAEVSQGTLQSIYEFQSLICRLTGLEVANASMYDGASAAAEAALLAMSTTRRNRVLVSECLHPHYRQLIRTYLKDRGGDVVMIAAENGAVATADLKEKLVDAACFIFQNPNFYGVVEPTDELSDLVHDAGALLIAVVNPISLALLKTPAEYDADVCVGEGQALGNTMSFGGPYFGFFASRKKYARQLPGRLVAATEDREGRRGFCLTLQTREQHIRRDKATSNICTNQALCALAGAIYLSALGKEGLRDVAKLCLSKAHYLQRQLCSLAGIELAFDRGFFHEFTLRTALPARRICDQLQERGILAGVPASRFLSDEDLLIVCATEKRTREEMDHYEQCLKEVMS
jgi:glycine dehydrogenase subunit 1